MTTKQDIDRVLDKLEMQGVFLSDYGNHYGSGSLKTREQYYKSRDEGTLFAPLEEIDAIRALIRKHVDDEFANWISSYEIKHSLERKSRGYISNGDCALAMILEGYSAKWFYKYPNEQMVNPHFAVRIS